MSESNTDPLIAAAYACCGEFVLGTGPFTAASASSALETVSGKIHTGICLNLACGVGFCAEHAAVAAMLLTRETKIRRIVAVVEDKILAPCGRCRELLVQIDRDNLDCIVLLEGNRQTRLRDLIPEHWVADRFSD